MAGEPCLMSSCQGSCVARRLRRKWKQERKKVPGVKLIFHCDKDMEQANRKETVGSTKTSQDTLWQTKTTEGQIINQTKVSSGSRC
ncbi:hypothetical protein EJB05_35698, partial [Eragrostis curvula]